MKIEINGKEYILNVKLGIVKDIQKQFNKTFQKVAEEMINMKIEEQVKLLLVAVEKDEKKEVEDGIYEYWGLEKLYETLALLIQQIQYPGLTQEQLKEKEKEGLEHFKKAREIGLI